jgi:hypothetical protein
MDVKDLSTIGQDKEKQILNLKLPMPSDKPITTKEFNEFSIYNFDQVGRILLGILENLKGQLNINKAYEGQIGNINMVLDNWIKEAKKLEENSKKEEL